LEKESKVKTVEPLAKLSASIREFLSENTT
jgi:hypothetical protein